MTCVEQYLYFYQFYWKPEGGDTKGLCGALRGCASYLIFLSPEIFVSEVCTCQQPLLVTRL